MQFKQYLAAAAAAMLVAACGGGSESQLAATPQAAVEALRAQSAVLAPMASTPAQAADQLMDFAEATFPGFFPVHKPTGTLGAFAYRYYPETGVYLGVVVSAAEGLQLYGVYVMGGAFGTAPAYVGPLTQFVNVDIGSGGGNGGGAGNGCYDLTLADTQGTRILAKYRYLGAVTGNQTVETEVGEMTMFHGYQARQTNVTITGTNVAGGMAMDGLFTISNYLRRTGTAEVTQYGSEMSATATADGETVNMNITSLFTPPYLDRQYALALGETYTSSQTLQTTMSVEGYNYNSTTTSTVSVRYAGQETVTVPAGTYATCKFETTSVGPAGAEAIQTSWVIKGKGIAVRSSVTGSGANDQVIEATEVRLNGTPL